MKKDQYIPHEVSMRNTSEVMNLIENEGMAGYGIYWALMEYLRTQDDYTGDVRVLKSLARQLKTKIGKIEAVLNNYGLFIATDYTFRSTKLETIMKPLEEKRKAMSKQNKGKTEAKQKQNEGKTEAKQEQNEGKPEAERIQKPCNSLKTNDDVSLSKVKESKEEKRITSSSKEDGNGVGVSTSIAWERYVDGLAKEQQWIEIMAMRSGLGKAFVQRFPEVLKHFKLHVQAVGGENRIRSLSDAKLYFNNFNKPGSTPFVRLVEELRKPVDKGKYRYEDRHPDMGPRSYCGVPIPPEAPPRPNNQAVWCRGKWRY